MSMRQSFVTALAEEMRRDERIVLLCADVGYGVLDRIRDDFPGRFWNTGAAEQVCVGAAVGMALDGKIPFVYSITPFLLCRPFEWLRNYINHEKVPVRLVGIGLDDDYKGCGITHEAYDAKAILGLFPNIHGYFPAIEEDIPGIVSQMCHWWRPAFLALRR